MRRVLPLLLLLLAVSSSCTSPPPVETPTSLASTEVPTPKPSATPQATYTPTPSYIEYVTKANDTLWDIANEYGTTYQEIMQLNGLTDTTIHSGTRLLIPSAEQPVSTPGIGPAFPTPTPARPPATASPVPPTATPSPTGCPTGCTVHKAGCDIKGDISVDTGEKIYYVPGDEHYEEAIVRAEEGERWFCTEQEATSNGWRRSEV